MKGVYLFSNTFVTFNAQFIKNLSNTEADLRKESIDFAFIPLALFPFVLKGVVRGNIEHFLKKSI